MTSPWGKLLDYIMKRPKPDIGASIRHPDPNLGRYYWTCAVCGVESLQEKPWCPNGHPRPAQEPPPGTPGIPDDGKV